MESDLERSRQIRLQSRIHGKTVLVAAIFISSIFILGIRLSHSTPIQIFIEGNQTAVSQLPGFFTLTDVLILITASFVLCASGIYLLFFDSGGRQAGKIVLDERKKGWEGMLKTLKSDEQKICRAIIDSDGIISQSELTEKAELPKANVSRALDMLESKGLVERRRRGMGNVVLLK